MADTIEKVIRLPEVDVKLSADQTAQLKPIQDAVLQDDAHLLAPLIQKLAPPAPYLQRQLFTAVARGHVASARSLLAAGLVIDTSVVFAACYKAKLIEMFELLVEYGWNVNADFRSGPAVRWVLGDEQLVQWFLNHGANPNVGRKDEWDPDSAFSSNSGQVLNHAACASSLSVFELLLRHGAQLELSFALHNAAGTKFTDERRKLMQFLIEVRHVDINQLDTAMGPRKIGSPLFYAARNGNTEAIKFLLEHGADATLKNHRDITAVGEAEWFHQEEAAELLRKSLPV